jgi:hypothetical protein
MAGIFWDNVGIGVFACVEASRTLTEGSVLATSVNDEHFRQK